MCSPYAPSVPLNIHWLKRLPFYDVAKATLCFNAFQRIHNNLPTCLNETLKLNSEKHNRQTRYCNYNLVCPKFVRQTEGGRMFAYMPNCETVCIYGLDLQKSNFLNAFKHAI